MTYPPIVVVEVEFAVSVAVVVPGNVIDDGMLQVTGLVGLGGVVVTEQLRFTVPVSPPEGVTVIVDVFPVVAPAFTVMAPLLVIAKSCGRLIVTPTTVVDVMLLLELSFPVTVMA